MQKIKNTGKGRVDIVQYFTVLLGGIFLLAPSFVFAGFVNPINAPTLQDFLVAILNSVIFILFPILVLMMVYTGYLFVAAQGRPEKLQEARRALVWTIIGSLIVLGSRALALAVQATIDSL